MAEKDPIDQVWSVLEQVRRRVEPILAGDSAAARAVRADITTVLFAGDQARLELGDVAGKVATAASDPRYAVAEQRRQANQIIADYRASIDGLLVEMETAAANAIAALTPMTVPPRPTPDAVQVAELARRENELRMVLDSLPVADVVPRLGRYLADAVARGDALEVWHLAGSGWATSYLESRGNDLGIHVWQTKAAELAMPALGDEPRIAREILGVLEGQYGLRAATLAARTAVNMRFDEASRMVPR